MLLNGVNHVALLTRDTGRLAAFYREVFDAEIGAHLKEFDGAIRLTFIRIGETAELNVFQIEGNTEAGRQPLARQSQLSNASRGGAAPDQAREPDGPDTLLGGR